MSNRRKLPGGLPPTNECAGCERVPTDTGLGLRGCSDFVLGILTQWGAPESVARFVLANTQANRAVRVCFNCAARTGMTPTLMVRRVMPLPVYEEDGCTHSKAAIS